MYEVFESGTSRGRDLLHRRRNGWRAGDGIGNEQGQILNDVQQVQLRPELLQRACAQAAIPLLLRAQAGYDHSYYFVSTFMEDHLRWHAARLTG